MEVVIVNHNTCKQLRDCLNPVLAEHPDQVIVVDNASTDGSAEMIQREFPSIQFLSNAKNLGYGAAANRAAAHCSTPYFLLLNSDTILRTGALQKLSDYLDQNPKVAIIGPRLLDPRLVLQPSCFPFPTPVDILLDVIHFSRLVRYLPGLRDWYLRSWSHLSTRSVPWVVGAAMAIRREAFQAVGGFDETFFMYYEEVDLCYRLLQSRWQIHYLPSAEILHVGGASTEKYRTDMIVQFYGSLAHFYRRHYSKWRITQLILLVKCIAFARWIRDSLKLFISQDKSHRSRLAQNTTAWRRLFSGEWRG